MKKFVCILLVFIQMVCIACSAFAQEVVPCADEVFSDAYINLTSSKAASYTAMTFNSCGTIKVTSSSLQKKINGTWVTIANISVAGEGSDTYSCTLRADCSSHISTGTYRVVGTFSADGYCITRTSNERTY